MLLTSLDRVLIHNSSGGKRIKKTIDNVGLLTQWIVSISDQINEWLERDVELKTGVIEFFDINKGRVRFYVSNYPITTLTKVERDNSGLFTGDETELLDNKILGNNQSRFEITEFTGSGRNNEVITKAIKATYNGGIAKDATNIKTTVIIDTAGTLVTGNFWKGISSGAVGKALDTGALTTTVNIGGLYGIFKAGEQIKHFDNELGDGTPAAAATITTIDDDSLAQLTPALVKACELEIRYNMKHTGDFENTETTQEGTRRRSTRIAGGSREGQGIIRPLTDA